MHSSCRAVGNWRIALVWHARAEFCNFMKNNYGIHRISKYEFGFSMIPPSTSGDNIRSFLLLNSTVPAGLHGISTPTAAGSEFSASPLKVLYFGCGKITDVGTFSFRWILPFWYFCFLLADKSRVALSAKRKQSTLPEIRSVRAHKFHLRFQ